MKPCLTCHRAGTLAMCRDCVERAESMLHAPIPWTPLELCDVHPDLMKEGFESCWKNSRYTVLVRYPDVDRKLVHLSIKRNDKNPLHDWRDLQRIKNEILGDEEEAVELFPAESRLVDGANQYHLWSFAGDRFPFGYGERVVMLPGATDGSKQRPFEEAPKDAMTEAEFEVRLRQHKERMAARRALAAQIDSVITTIASRRCQRAEIPGLFECSETPSITVDKMCCACAARELVKLGEELAKT